MEHSAGHWLPTQYWYVVVFCCCCSVTESWPTLCNPMNCSTPGFPVLHYLPEFAQTHVWVDDGLIIKSIKSMMSSNHLIPLLLLPSIFPSIRISFNESALCIRWPKDWNFSFSSNPSNEYLGLISFKTDWFDLLTVQGTLKSPPTPQFKSINSSVLSLLYGPTLTWLQEKHSFDYMDLYWQSNLSLLFNTLSSFAIAFLPRSKRL